ncbi:MAG: biotin--[Bacteroidales bacterium]|nr:biotin--[acetyl-CoA-carboxylase] ligase [Bacteroidales bacterium]
MRIVKFDSLESTNKYCEALDLMQVEDFTCYWAIKQTDGIGQRGNHWEAAPGRNLTFSLVLHPTFLPADRQFRLTEAFSLAVLDFIGAIDSIKPIVSIKWPNDIYVAGKKICGTLISARITTQAVSHSNNLAVISSAVCGIGFNVNQTAFPDWVPNPISLGMLTGRHYDLEPLLMQLLHSIEVRYNALREGVDMEQEYLGCLLNLGIAARYKYEEKEIVATITGVDPHGRLLLTAEDGRRLSCGMKEIAWLM